MHPNPSQDIHPWLPSVFHGRPQDDDDGVSFTSKLAGTCQNMGISIHDREVVYEALKKIEAEIITKRDERQL